MLKICPHRKMNIVTIVGIIVGIFMYLSFCIRVAPSISAASSKALSTLDNAAKKIIELQPTPYTTQFINPLYMGL